MARLSTPDERRSFILQVLAENGRLTTSELSAQFEMSEDSARRDFRELAGEGLIQRVHGAAVQISPATLPFSARYKSAANSKDRLAQKAVTAIAPGQVVLFDGGTTNLAIARHIPPTLAFTAITVSPLIATALINHQHANIVLIGGTFDKRSQMTIGARTLDEIRQVYVDICFFGIHGIDSEAGLTTANYDEAAIKKAMIESAAEVIAVATAEKVGTAAAYRIGPTALINRLFSEKHSSDVQLAAIAKSGTIVELA